MVAWVVIGVASVAAYVVVLLAMLGGGRSEARVPTEPPWLIPSPVEVRKTQFPVAFRGYDPVHVDVYVDALAAAYEELYAAAGPEAVENARARLALRLGREEDTEELTPSVGA